MCVIEVKCGPETASVGGTYSLKHFPGCLFDCLPVGGQI